MYVIVTNTSIASRIRTCYELCSRVCHVLHPSNILYSNFSRQVICLDTESGRITKKVIQSSGKSGRDFLLSIEFL